MYGAAVLDACEKIMARMEPIASQQKFNSFAEVLSQLQFLSHLKEVSSHDKGLTEAWFSHHAI